jgi:GTP cyclohydrolase II
MRRYWLAAAILRDLKIKSVRLLTNNPEKIRALTDEGVPVTARVPIEVGLNRENQDYLTTKVVRMNHLLPGVPASTKRVAAPYVEPA